MRFPLGLQWLDFQAPGGATACLLAIAVIAAMTVGKDVGSLFPNVVKCIQTENLELKKLVYLYVINYART